MPQPLDARAICLFASRLAEMSENRLPVSPFSQTRQALRQPRHSHHALVLVLLMR